MSRWRETIGNGFGTSKHKGETKEVPVTDERDGTVGGKLVQHWDGRQDAHVIAKGGQAGAGVQGSQG